MCILITFLLYRSDGGNINPPTNAIYILTKLKLKPLLIISLINRHFFGKYTVFNR